MHGTDMRAAHERATWTENEQSLDLPFELLNQQCLLQTRASAVQVQLTGSRRTEAGKAGEKQNEQKAKQTPQSLRDLRAQILSINCSIPCSSRKPSNRHSKEMVLLTGLLIRVLMFGGSSNQQTVA